jgi:hypothetical protein
MDTKFRLNKFSSFRNVNKNPAKFYEIITNFFKENYAVNSTFVKSRVMFW